MVRSPYQTHPGAPKGHQESSQRSLDALGAISEPNRPILHGQGPVGAPEGILRSPGDARSP